MLQEFPEYTEVDEVDVEFPETPEDLITNLQIEDELNPEEQIFFNSFFNRPDGAGYLLSLKEWNDEDVKAALSIVFVRNFDFTDRLLDKREQNYRDNGYWEVDIPLSAKNPNYDGFYDDDGGVDILNLFMKDSSQEALKTTEIYYLAHAVWVGNLAKRLDKLFYEGRYTYLPEDDMEFLQNSINRLKRAKDILVLANSGLVVYWAKYMRNHDMPRNASKWPLLDLIMYGNVGFLMGIEKFNPARGTKLSTYLSHYIRQPISREVKARSYHRRIPDHMHKKFSDLYAFMTEFEREKEYKPEASEIAVGLGIALDDARELLRLYRQNYSELSLDAPIRPDQSDRTLADKIEDQEKRTEKIVLDRMIIERMKQIINNMGEPYKEVLNLRYFGNYGEGMSFEEIGQKIKRSREMVRRYESQALRILRVELEKASNGEWDEYKPGNGAPNRRKKKYIRSKK
ncbi:MAG: RNA polymerase sigma factor [candidate division WS6 bacterium GW2011_GWA2_37_6]|uniref:RNA polymerase sigma factor n=1 Tax=candidate division WS6 bacterium GW2011_GWA2_37_6 TaxID=1619087 RepID=A0A0G0JFW0_9BACT|nr:MAG: RNA polymerase sigma factor [candidate division WS6 bacterium GW2011_GWA2_37_6]